MWNGSHKPGYGFLPSNGRGENTRLEDARSWPNMEAIDLDPAVVIAAFYAPDWGFTCPRCDGTGESGTCPVCDGQGCIADED